MKQMNRMSDNSKSMDDSRKQYDIDSDPTMPGSDKAGESSANVKARESDPLKPEDPTIGDNRTGEGELEPVIALKSGDLFAGRYQILNTIGVGGMGEVYQVRDMLADSEVALKRIRTDIAAREDIRKRFIREANISKNISSWNVVRVYDVNQYDNVLFYTMEYLEGRTLRARLDELKSAGEHMPLDEVRTLVKAVCRGLSDAHRLTVHRDLKPENIFILESGDIRILDFGLAHALHGTRMTVHVQRMGTPYYMAPEQRNPSDDNDHTIDCRADIFSLGVIVYEMLTSDLPTGFELVSEERDDVSNEIDDFVRRCLSRRPDNRPASAAEFYIEFDSIISQDIEVLHKRQNEEAARQQREEQYREAFARASAVKPDDLDDALRVWQELASTYPEKTEATEKVSEFQKRIHDRDEARRQAEFQKQGDRKEQIQVTRNEELNKAQTGYTEKISNKTKTMKLETQKTEQFDIGNGVSMDMVYIPPGSFQMGSPDNEEGRWDNEGPVHNVNLDGFWMGKYPVTQLQYQSIMGNAPFKFQKKTVLEKGFLGIGRKTKKGIYPDHPAEQISWNDAMEFNRKLSQRTGRTFTLPTEAQWEYACRAGTTTRFYFGDDVSRLGEYAWYDGNSNLQTHPVGRKKPNAWGLYDMHGNVWEWCLDWYGSYTSGTKRNPVGPGSGSYRVGRGGSWLDHARYCRSADRGRNTPSSAGSYLGFRLVSPDPS